MLSEFAKTVKSGLERCAGARRISWQPLRRPARGGRRRAGRASARLRRRRAAACAAPCALRAAQAPRLTARALRRPAPASARRGCRSNPELKKSLDELKSRTSSLADKCVAAGARRGARSAAADARRAAWRCVHRALSPRRAREGLAGTAGAARDGLGDAQRKASAAVGGAQEELLKAVRPRRRSARAAVRRRLSPPRAGGVAAAARARAAAAHARPRRAAPLQAKQTVGEPAELLQKGRSILSSLREGLPGASGGPAGGAAGADAGAGAGGAGASEQQAAGAGAEQRAPPPPRSAAAGLLSRARAWAAASAADAAAAVRAEVKLAMMDEGDAAAERARERAAAAPAAAPGPLNTTATALAVAKPRVSAWQRRWGSLRAAAATSPLFASLGARLGAAAAASSAHAAPVVRRTRDAAADLRERWETSDSPLVHKLQDVGDSLRLEETEPARALAAIRSLQPDFDMHEFVAIVKRDVPAILGAYLRADVATLRAAGVAPELLERLGGLMAAWQADGTVMDSQILDVSDLEVVETKLLGDVPMVVLQFQIQQINCVRDRHGAVVEGAADDIQSVYYAWAMELAAPKQARDDDAPAPPRWRLRDMMVRGMHAIV